MDSGDVLAHPRITNMHAKVLRDPLVQYSRGLNLYSNIDELAASEVLNRHLSCLPIITHWDS